MVLLLAVLGLSLTCRAVESHVGLIILGVLFGALGAGFGVAGSLALGANLTPFPRPRENARLVQHGIYARVRHPLYTGVILGSAGWALIMQSWPALVAALILFPFFDAKARREENWLRGTYPDYAEYETRRRKFIPWVY